MPCQLRCCQGQLTSLIPSFLSLVVYTQHAALTKACSHLLASLMSSTCTGMKTPNQLLCSPVRVSGLCCLWKRVLACVQICVSEVMYWPFIEAATIIMLISCTISHPAGKWSAMCEWMSSHYMHTCHLSSDLSADSASGCMHSVTVACRPQRPAGKQRQPRQQHGKLADVATQLVRTTRKCKQQQCRKQLRDITIRQGCVRASQAPADVIVSHWQGSPG